VGTPTVFHLSVNFFLMTNMVMKSISKSLSVLLLVLLLNGCAVYAVYGLYRTVNDITQTLTQVDDSINRIQGILNEGKELKRAAEDGKLITTLAEKIPTLIQKEVERRTKEKIETLSLALKVSSIVFTKTALAEDLPGAKEAYGEMSDTYNEFTGLMDELSDSIGEPLR